jgi:hypothetical protein
MESHPDVLEACVVALPDDRLGQVPAAGYRVRSGHSLTEAALDVVRRLLAVPVPKIGIENPHGRIGAAIRPADQTVQPWQFGDDASKATGLWLVGLPLLVPDVNPHPGRLVTDPRTGQAACRSTVNPGAAPHPGSEFFPTIAPGFFTFRPGDGQCAPVSLFRGTNSVSQAGVDFITTPTTNRFRLEQTVITGLLNGDTGAFFNLPGGALQFSLGAEYRKERSRSRFNDLLLGLLPEGSRAHQSSATLSAEPANWNVSLVLTIADAVSVPAYSIVPADAAFQIPTLVIVPQAAPAVPKLIALAFWIVPPVATSQPAATTVPRA